VLSLQCRVLVPRLYFAGVNTLGFFLLSGVALICFAVNYLVFLPRQEEREPAAFN